jgi:hypothetical protein
VGISADQKVVFTQLDIRDAQIGIQAGGEIITQVSSELAFVAFSSKNQLNFEQIPKRFGNFIEIETGES